MYTLNKKMEHFTFIVIRIDKDMHVEIIILLL